MEFFWIILSYILGSFPSGYLISRASGKDILKIGWRKTSGSNVFKNIGRWQGTLTGLLDVLKGFLAVYGAQQMELGIEIQILSGVLAVVGHNWSLFLKFAGGRGIGTLFGAFLAFSPKILGLSLIPFIVLSLIWDAAPAAILFLFTAVFLSTLLSQFSGAGFFALLTTVPIFIKRLSPIKEVFSSRQKGVLIRNRLIFDNDQANLKLRIARLWQGRK